MKGSNGEVAPEEVIPFVAGDGMACNLLHVVGSKPPTKGPVLLVHGAGVRANIFRAPVDRSLVDYLRDDGFDVWLENWRASTDLRPNQWTLDQAAVFDHPNAVRTVAERTGSSEVQAVIHCQGSTSFMMSAVAGLLPQVTTVVSNAVSLHPVVPRVARWKGQAVVPAIRLLTKYIDPHWGVEAPDVIASAVVGWVRLTHRECENTVCRMVSFTYGVGAPTLWSHQNLNDATHEWVKQEFGTVPLTFFAQMDRCIEAGHLVSVDGHPELPRSFVAQPPETDARFAFLAGDHNRCFLHESQEQTFAFFDDQRPGYHSLHVLPNYGHLDVFMGKEAAQDVFPIIRDELLRRS
jgi:pimeloyl-ACP methyl ester carboxylesterase